MQRKSLSSYSRWIILLSVFAVSIGFSDPLEILGSKAKSVSSDNQRMGWAYLTSGALALGVSIPAYYLSEDLFSKIVYGIGETVGVGAIGYGTYLILIENEYSQMAKVIEGVPSLSVEERTGVARVYLTQGAERAKSARAIRALTHGLIAGLNVLNGATSTHKDVKTAFYFIGGVNLLVAVGAALFSSDEERLLDSVSLTLGPYSSVSFRF